MLYYGIPTLVFLAVVAAVMAAAVIQFINHRLKNPKLQPDEFPTGPNSPPSFLFDGQVLINATQRGRDLLRGFALSEHTLEAIGQALDPHFPGLLVQLRRHDVPSATIAARNTKQGTIRVQNTNGVVHITLTQDAYRDINAPPLYQDELDILKHISEDTQLLVWRTDKAGSVIWANKAYVSLSDRLTKPDDEIAKWPPEVLFPDSERTRPTSTPRRVAAKHFSTGELAWYDITSLDSTYGRVHFGTDAAAIVYAEDQMSFFLQTMTKTFSQLSTGLAVFDASRQLVIFNPALLELTNLPFTLLSQEPKIETFLDALRDRTILPEPKDYQLWREEFLALEADTTKSELNDLWSLPDGRTYRVTVRHHSEGSLAFMIEDVSSEMTMTRSYRNEMSIAYATLDALEDSIAVFAANGTLINSNDKYDAEWANPTLMSQPRLFAKEMAHWRDVTEPSGLWSQAFDRLPLHQDRPKFAQHVTRSDKTVHKCTIAPLINGATLVRFTSIDCVNTQPENLFRTPDLEPI